MNLVASISVDLDHLRCLSSPYLEGTVVQNSSSERKIEHCDARRWSGVVQYFVEMGGPSLEDDQLQDPVIAASPGL